MQASGGQSLQLASCAHGRGLPCLPTVSYSLLTAGSQLALRNPGQQAGSPGSTAGGGTLGLVGGETGYGELRRPWARISPDRPPLAQMFCANPVETI